jgi:hypothetical protein
MPTLPAESHQPATDKKQIFAEAAERLRIAQEAEGLNRQKAVIDLEFEDGQQWPDDLYNLRKVNKRPTLTINHTRAMVKRVVNNMREQRPRIKVHAVGQGADKDIAQKLQGIIRHIEYRSSEAVGYDLGGEFAVKMGWGYWRVGSAYIDDMSFEQELEIWPVYNPFTVYMDPAARDCTASDAEWCIISEEMKRSEFERKFPRTIETEWTEGAAGDQQASQWQTKEMIRLAEYFRFVKREDELIKLSDGRSMYDSEYRRKSDVFSAAGLTRAKDLRGRDIRRPTYRKQLEWHRLNGSQVVESVELPGKWIPVIRCEGNTLDLNGQIRRKGMVRDMMDVGRMYNYWRTCETEMIALAPRAPWIGTAQQFQGHPEWNDANQKPYSKLTYNADFLEQPDGSKVPLPAPQRVETVAVPAGFVQAAESAMKDMMILAGMPHEPGQDAPGVVVSGKALRQRQAISDISHFQYYDNQTRSIAQTGRVLLDLIPQYYSEERMQRIVGDDGVPSTVQINSPGIDAIKNDLSVGRYDVVMDTGPGYETKRQEEAEQTVDLLKIGPLAEAAVKAAPDLIFRAFGMDEIADRIAITVPEGMQKALEGMPQDAQNIIKGVMQQLQVANQHIQQLELEQKYGLGKAQIAANAKVHDTQVDAATKVHDTSTRAATEIDKAHIGAQASIAVAEIGQAGKLMDSHVKGKYAQESEKAAAKAESKSNP